MSRGGWFTNARAMETRCCSPPESSSGYELVLCVSPTRLSTSGHLLADLPLVLTLHLQRVGDVLVRRPVGEQLEVLEHAADVAPQHRHLRALEASELAAADDDAPVRGLDLLQQELDHRRLAGSRGPDEEDELALLDREAHLGEGHHVGLVDLRDPVEEDHRPPAGAQQLVDLVLGDHLVVRPGSPRFRRLAVLRRAVPRPRTRSRRVRHVEIEIGVVGRRHWPVIREGTLESSVGGLPGAAATRRAVSPSAESS